MKPLAAALSLLLLAACTDADRAPTSPGAASDPGVAPASDARTTAAAPPATTGDTVTAPENAPFCPDGETVVFGCRNSAGVDALCGSPDGARMTYRSGAAQGAAPPAVYPSDDTAPSQAFRGGTLMYSGGGGAFLRFDHQGQVHTLYTGIGRGWEKAGVVIASAGDAPIERSCDGDVVSQIGPALFARSGIPTDPAGFEIP
ncbi:hypothetical protein MNO14_09765 [Luteimonas sp. S4-F44]|uniref:hypothetical protein n=1 Tax=Luteimonas sp. S4-F44 TaxID=2925842 RepID=UPI001F5397D6|nr:hypothetical protein [Luteimonas sp. S4-F44]UNK41270.1 hypothetical protein MNO14_09765 [Luteimonas sp. S4-F44]